MDVVVLVFLLHYLADWILQSLEMGREKSNKFNVLCQHIFVIFLVIFAGTIPLLGLEQAAVFSGANALTHAVIDWNIWRIYRLTVKLRHPKVPEDELRKTFKFWEDPVFGHFLGLDQLAHYVILYLIYGSVF